MARKREDDSWIEPIVKLGAFALLGVFAILGIRPTLSSMLISMLVVLGVAAAGAVCLVIYRKAIHETSEGGLRASTGVQCRAWSAVKPVVASNAVSTFDLVQKLRDMDWFQFEKVVGHVYRKLGYTVTRRGGANPDGGIDLIVEKDGQRSAIQCKQWKTWNVGVKAVRELLGALTDAGISKGTFITLRGYTGEAKQLAGKHDIEMLDEAGLAQLLESTEARFDPAVLELLRDTRKFCPKCERELIVRIARKGSRPGSKFWGCSDYPRCRFTMPMDKD